MLTKEQLESMGLKCAIAHIDPHDGLPVWYVEAANDPDSNDIWVRFEKFFNELQDAQLKDWLKKRPT